MGWGAVAQRSLNKRGKEDDDAEVRVSLGAQLVKECNAYFLIAFVSSPITREWRKGSCLWFHFCTQNMGEIKAPKGWKWDFILKDCWSSQKVSAV